MANMMLAAAIVLVLNICHTSFAFIPFSNPSSLIHGTTRSSSKWVIYHGGGHTDQLQEPAIVGNDVRIEDQNVPEGHKGLHELLYGDGDAHMAVQAIIPDYSQYDGTKVYDVTQWLKENGEGMVAAVYEVQSAQGTVNFVGVSRNVAVSLKAHVKEEGANEAAKVRLTAFKFPDRIKMEGLKKEWIAATGTTPKGNIKGQEWATTVGAAARAGMSEEEKNNHEDSKMRMLKAMADQELSKQIDAAALEAENAVPTAESMAERRRRIEAAVEGDDWSAVIDAQTAKTIAPPLPVAAAAVEGSSSSFGAPVSPVPATASLSECKDLEFTKENVDKVLDEVRPYLVSDGGNCRIAGIDPVTRSVSVLMEGACGSCPSSTVTMKMGIERVLRENFKNLGEIRQVDSPVMLSDDVTADVVEQILAKVRPAVVAMKGGVSIKSAYNGEVILEYEGPPTVAKGLKAAVLDNPLVQELRFVDKNGQEMIV